MAISSDGLAIYVVNYGSASMSKIRTSDMHILQTVITDASPIGITYEPTKKQVCGLLWRFVDRLRRLQAQGLTGRRRPPPRVTSRVTRRATYPVGVLRTALKPKWLCAAGAGGPDHRRLHPTRPLATRCRPGQGPGRGDGRPARPPVARDLASPHAPFPAAANARLAIVTGTYAEGQVLIPARLLAGRDGCWLLTPMTESDRRGLPGRSWLAAAGSGGACPPPRHRTGETTVVASLAPGESPTTELSGRPTRVGRPGPPCQHLARRDL